ncbi:unnamed protein product [Cladocopium goreaui]|uniref:Uncharacterized protein n=1 Tax=Cladocopium goreaui TaxID=2562237 RepID=A0A9P1FNL9_9DINO|nr:unnamed protein product [Cladocopium goreaui]
MAASQVRLKERSSSLDIPLALLWPPWPCTCCSCEDIALDFPTILHRRGLGTTPFMMFLPKSSIEASLCTASRVRAILWCMCRHCPSIITWVPGFGDRPLLRRTSYIA